MIIWLILFLKNFLNTFLIVIIIATTILYLYAYINITISYPGFAKPIDYDHESIYRHIRFCPICRTIQINHVYHCGDCNICIQDYDHHCPWTGKCIGGKNVRSFHFFLMMVFAEIAVCLISLLYQSATTEQNEIIHSNFWYLYFFNVLCQPIIYKVYRFTNVRL